MEDHMELPGIEKATVDQFTEITDVWEASVRATHHFLSEEDILFFRSLILAEYLHAVDLYCTRDENKRITGFLGTSGDKLEMLFIHPENRGQSIGKKLLHFAVDNLNVSKVDVNEQNEQEVGFYRHFGFRTVARSEKDGMGKTYPILHMELCS